MHPPSSSISSSDPMPPERKRPWSTLIWAAFWILVIDVAINIAFAFPEDVKDTSPPRMALFFDYGRSMEGRLRRMTRDDPDMTAPITLAGWYQPLQDAVRSADAKRPTVTIYGMSHAVRLADALDKESSAFNVRSVGAPGATANWAYGAFRRDPKRKESDIAVLAIMSSTLPMITSVAPMTWNESFPLAYTADRFRISKNGLQVIEPPFSSFAAFTEALGDDEKWRIAVAHLKQNDPFYDPLLFDATPLDHSSLVRMARRAWGSARDREAETEILTSEGFDPKSEAVRVANALLVDFAARARQEGIIPVVYIVNNYGYSDHLFNALRRTLDAHKIAYVSSHQFVDPAYPRNYLPDTHFTDANDRLLAAALRRVVIPQLSERGREAEEKR
jgi:hypothetical protein